MRKLLILLLCSQAWATTYYVSISSGSDSNTSTQATNKATPWAHLKYMKSATGNAASYAIQPGDVFILMGCDVWPNANFPIHWQTSGTSGSPITIDRDTTWYNTTNCASAWNRPVFDAGSAVINPPDTGGLGNHFFVYFDTVTYVTFKWIEAKDFYWDNVDSGYSLSAGHVIAGYSDYITLDSWYIHHWTHSSTAGTTDIPPMIATAYNASPYCSNCLVTNTVIDNSDGDGSTCTTDHSLCSGGGVTWSLTNSVCHNVVACWYGSIYNRPSTTIIAGNDMQNLNLSFTTPTQSAPPHPNCIETTGVVNGTTGSAVVLVHDNYIHNILTCEGMQVGNPNEDDYAWNNIWDMGATITSGVNGPQVPQNTSGGGNFFFANNTVRWASGCMVAGGHSTTFTSFTVENNLCINDTSTVVNGTIPGASLNTNLGLTNATATTDGYTSAQTYPFGPTSGSSPTVAVGTNLTSTSPGCGTSGLSSLCSDTVFAVSEQTVGGVVQAVASGRTTNAEPSSGAWDIGYLKYASGSGSTGKPSISVIVPF